MRSSFRASGLLAVVLVLVLAVASGLRHTAWSTAAAASAPFFLFTTSKFSSPAEQAAIASTLRAHTTPADYLSQRLGEQMPDVAARIGPTHLYSLPASVKALQRQAADCSAQSPGLIIYDGEHWEDTPLDEQADLPGAVVRGKQAVRQSGCHAYGFAPDGEFVGLVPKACAADVGRGIHRRIDWDDIALFNVQAQRLLSDACAAQGGVETYVAFVTAVTREVKAKNPGTLVSAQFSFRYTPPDRMIAVIGRLRGVVDGFYIAYPSNMSTPCTYCSPANLDQVIRAIRPT